MGGETGDGDIMNIKSSTARADAIAALRAGAAGRSLGGGEGKEGGMVLDGSLESKAEKLAAFKAAEAAKAGPSEMVTPLQERSLKKEGYKIIGTHSAVKLCRWTKNQLRGRGGCYKHTMYGITSYQCMETTPSLACANKCVFCWRHHKNPVGREWRWKVDPAEMLVDGAIARHQNMIKSLKGACVGEGSVVCVGGVLIVCSRVRAV